ncbi:MAG TPA: FAD-dependent oxidoreductase, partial [Thermosynechococcaceae cyanobacterium]
MSKRLPPIPGEWIDRDRLIPFTFEGKNYTGFAGDTIASALWASGQQVLGRSFKYHRPRGILSFANHDINTLMQAGQKLNIRADVTPLEEGMVLSATNTFGGLANDRASVINFFSAFLPVGFYYKAFHSKQLFPIWERLIRSLTGLGKLDFSTPHLRTPKRYDFCDVLIVGAGVSGLSAALSAAKAGADVVLVDENLQAGGAGHYQQGGNSSQAEKTQELINSVLAHPKIRLYTETQAAGYFADHWIPLIDRTRLTKLRAKAVIVATGAYEQPAIFRNNDLPGIMLASAAQRLLYRYAVKPMERAIVLTANDEGYQAALDLAAHGVTVQAIVDLRDSSNSEGISRARSLEIPIYFNHCIYEAKSNPAKDGVSSAVICPVDVNQKPQVESRQVVSCDGILMSVGWASAANLLYQAGTKMQFAEDLQQFIPEKLPAGTFACGRVNGVFEFEKKVQDGDRAGQEAASYLGLQNDGIVPHLKALTPSVSSEAAHSATQNSWLPILHPKGKEFVDFDEDLQLKDFFNAVQEGFDNIELLKRYTTVGMGPSQGKHSNLNALKILAKLTGKTPAEVGTTTARPFFHPVPLSHLAGRSFTPERRTALYDRHIALKAEFMLSGSWKRPEYYAQPDKTREECVRSEAIAVRNSVGIIDVGTLGKIELWGPDASEFLERVYTGRFKNQKVGTTRYAVMLDEAGIVIDDGVVARLEKEHFYFTTTTSGAANVYRELLRLNTVWQLDCGIVNSTGARSAINLAGQNSRAVLTQLTDCDLSTAAFPYLGVQQAIVGSFPVILIRVGFVGEWGYEIHVASEFASALWDALMTAGAAYKIQPFGVE